MKKLVFLILLAYSPLGLSWTFDNSLGLGLKYAGTIGYQAVISEEEHNVRGALGLFGVSIGYDYKLSNNFSIGVTTGAYSFPLLFAARAHTLNLTCHFSGVYTQGWNISFDTGAEKCLQHCESDTDYSNISLLSLGYTF